MEAILATFLDDAVGLRCGLLMARWSSLYAPTRSAVGFGLERLPGRRLFPGGNVVGFTPRAASGSRVRFGGPVGSPASHPRWLLVSPPNGWSSARKGGEGPPLGKARLAWATTVTCDADHVTFCRNQRFLLGANLKNPLKPRRVGISPAPDRPLPACSHFVIILLCDVNHSHQPAKGQHRPGSMPR